MARIVAAGVPHHVTQRGNRRQKVFFSDSGYECYRALQAEGCRKAGVDVLGYCLMPNHVPLILVPHEADGLRAALSEAPALYARSEFPGGLARLPVVGPFCVLSDGRALSSRLHALRSIRCGRGWSRAPAIGAGRAQGRICVGATTHWSR